MTDGYGKIFLMLLAIGVIFLAASGKGKQVWEILTSSDTSSATKQIQGGGGIPVHEPL